MYSICYENVISCKVLTCLIRAWFVVKDAPPTDFNCMILDQCSCLMMLLRAIYWLYSLSSYPNYCCVTQMAYRVFYGSQELMFATVNVKNKNDLQKTFWHACDLLLSLLSGQNDANLQKKWRFCKKLKTTNILIWSYTIRVWQVPRAEASKVSVNVQMT